MNNKILLIDDNPDIRENTGEILELAGYEVDTADNGKRGVGLARKKDYDLIICDIMMPDLNGYDVLHILTKDPKTSLIPFIFLTAKSEKADIRKGMSLGADDYLTKPFEQTDLLNAIELRLEKSKKLLAVRDAATKSELDQFMENVDSDISVEDLINERNTRTYRKKDVVYRQGEYPNALHYIKEGTIKLSQRNEDGKEFIVQICGPGEFLGYLTILENGPYTEDAVAMKDSEVALISVPDFKKLIHSNREVTNNFIKLLSRKVIDHEKRLLQLAYGNLRERVAGIIINLFERYGDGEERMGLNISRDELAGYAGIAPESLSRTISDFKAEGLLGSEGRHLTLLDEQRLKRISSGGI